MKKPPVALMLLLLGSLGAQPGDVFAAPSAATSEIAVGPQYDTTHVYVDPADFDRFTASLVATFGGSKSKQGVFQVTPTPSQTMSQLVLTPVGTISVFGFKTPIPYPFGIERYGYLVSDMDQAVSLAQRAGADLVVSTFPDPIGRDAVIEWPGGIPMQLYWHTQTPQYSALQHIPENRVYVSSSRADQFVKAFVEFSHGRVTAGNANAPGIEIGRPADHYRLIQIESNFGKMRVLVTDGQLPYPYGHEVTGYEVTGLQDTLNRAQQSGATILVAPYSSRDRQSAIVQFPGGYIAEIHAPIGP
jgi:hypothetical protein